MVRDGLPLFVPLLLLLQRHAFADSEITECNSMTQCQKSILTNSYINCYGYGACQGSISTSNNELGYIDCPADNGCSGSTLTADGHVYCEGASSCKYTTAIAHGVIRCGGMDSCYQSPSHVAMGLDSTELSVECLGQRACKYANIKSYGNTSCDGYSACHEAHIAAEGDVWCRAEKACNSAVIVSSNSTWCTSKASCHESALSSSASLHCLGSFGCYDAQITSTPSIIGAGFFSLRKATMDSDGVAVMTLSLNGFKSGYKAEVHCRPGSKCYVDCDGNACQQLQLKCYDGADCHVTPDECVPDGTKKRVKGVHCPIWRQIVVVTPNQLQSRRVLAISDGGVYSDVEDRLYGYDDDDDLDEVLDATDILSLYRFDKDDEADSSTTDAVDRSMDASSISLEIPATSEGHLLCDDYRECVSQRSSSDFVYCFGYEACEGMQLQADGVSDSFIECLAADSCQSAEIGGVRAVQCNAKFACRGATKISTQSTNGLIACNGHGACLDVVDTMSGIYVECTGSSACSHSQIKAFMDAQCGGFESCREAHIVSDNDAVYCTATRSCSEATIVANNADVVCSADNSCEYGEISAAALKSYGLRSSAFSVVDAASIIGFGSYALSYADVDSVNRASLSMRLWGDFSGYGATLVCRSGSKCVVDCKGSGCMDSELLCLYGSTCEVEPAECEVNSDRDQIVAGTYCPKWRSAYSKRESLAFVETLTLVGARRARWAVLRDELVVEARRERYYEVVVVVMAVWVMVAGVYVGVARCRRQSEYVLIK